MMDLDPAVQNLIPLIRGAGAWLAFGALIGAFHFLTLRSNVRMLVAGRSLPLVLATQLGRLALVGGALAVIAGHFGAPALVVAAAGILVARMAVIRLAERP